jgi:hypothetical protein
MLETKFVALLEQQGPVEPLSRRGNYRARPRVFSCEGG